jgi:hypothetical protein
MSTDKHGDEGEYRFVLYIDSEKPRCSYVADKLNQLCKQYLSGSYMVDVIDLRDDLSVVESQRIVAAPTLDVTTPQSKTHRFVGDLSQSEIFIVALGMAQEADRMGQVAGKMGQDAADMRNRIKSP